MSKHDNHNETRKERYKSKGNSSMLTKLAVGLAGLILIAFIFNYFLGDSKNEQNQVAGTNDQNEFNMIKKKPVSDSSEDSTSNSESQSEESSSQEAEKDKKNTDDKKKDMDKKEVESNDSNVKKAVVANWEPIGTKQNEPHVTSYDENSEDWSEMKAAVSQATGVSVDDMTINWVGNDGDQKITSTITQSSTGIIYKVYIEWVPNKGWKVNRVEELYAVVR